MIKPHKPIKIAFLGDDVWGFYFFKKLSKQNYLTSIVTTSSSKKLIAEGVEKSNPLYVIKNKTDKEFKNFIEQFQPDLIICAGFNIILRKDILDIPKLGSINIHGSYLPYYRGPQPLEWQIIKGETHAGVTIHYMDEGIDTGDILVQNKIPILDNDNLTTMMMKLSRLGFKLLNDVLEKLDRHRQLITLKQDKSKASYYGHISEDECRVDWSKSNKEIHNLIRAFPPFMPAFSEIGDYRYYFRKSKLIFQNSNKNAGQIISIPKDKNDPIIVAADNGIIAILNYFTTFQKQRLSAEKAIKVLSQNKSFQNKNGI